VQERLSGPVEADTRRSRRSDVDLAQPRPWLVIPIENNVRELDAKTLLAAAAAERGLGVVLTRISQVTGLLERLPAAVVLQKDVVGTTVSRPARRHGHVPVATDEEGLVQRDTDDYLRRRVSLPAIESCERFYAWGETHRTRLLQKVPHLAGRVLASGNPRADLLRPGLRELYRPQAEQIHRRFGAFVLVNSNFGAANHRLGRDYVRGHWATSGWSSGTSREGLLERIIAFQERLLDAFVLAVERLSLQLPDGVSIVVRPHPSEDHDTWRRRLAHCPTALVVHEGPVIPWLLATRALIHNGCTTGIEATLLGRPVFAYQPIRDPAVESPLPDLVSMPVPTLDELVDRVTRDPLPVRGPEDTVLRDHISHLSGELASDVITRDIEQTAPAAAPLGSPTTLHAHVARRRATVAACSYASAVAHRRWRQQRAYDALLRQTSTGMSAAGVQSVVDRLGHLTGRFSAVRCARLAPDVLVLAEAS
jgi:surface carbohydrate biosynthesis protein